MQRARTYNCMWHVYKTSRTFHSIHLRRGVTQLSHQNRIQVHEYHRLQHYQEICHSITLSLCHSAALPLYHSFTPLHCHSRPRSHHCCRCSGQRVTLISGVLYTRLLKLLMYLLISKVSTFITKVAEKPSAPSVTPPCTSHRHCPSAH